MRASFAVQELYIVRVSVSAVDSREWRKARSRRRSARSRASRPRESSARSRAARVISSASTSIFPGASIV
jgi:hypothetical protein